MTISKRDFLLTMAILAGSAVRSTDTSAQPAKGAAPPAEQTHDMSHFPAHWHGAEKIAFLAYPQFTALDLVGPHYMLGNLMGATTHIVARTREPVVSDMKLAIVPTATFDECPKDLDIICVPGGTAGTLAAMQDEATIAFLKDRGSRAKFVTSVCTGSLLLGAAGLLRGYKATSHWVTRDILRIFGAEPVDQRVVIDRNRMTGGGVTAGLDFGLSLVAKLRDADYAKALQLLAEYQPAPPFDAGTPAKAGAEATGMMTAMFDQFVKDARAAAEAAVRRL
ncbi:MAG: DJ-1/PfpI family protein [Hyphomicrobiaceae bacterium]|nr:DJ-1/PfpI family protein [Hyphomicrobiaceae bacterium]